MKSPPDDRISLLNELRSGRFDASISTTYNIHFPFFETVVHRRLLGVGCVQQIVLADRRQCAASLVADARPSLAGSSYALVPVDAPGAFHPKLHLLVGKRAGLLFVGSHNLTFSGFGGNAEITSLIRIDAKDRARVALAQKAIAAIRAWTAGQPELIGECLDVVEEAAPWLRGPVPATLECDLFWTAPGQTSSLWDQALGLLPPKAERVTLVGPFFDRTLEFVATVERTLQPRELVVGIDPDAVDLPIDAVKRLKNVRFVSIREALTTVGRGTAAPLHAKVVWIEHDAGNLLMTGSANPSRAAWLDPNRNAEAMIVRRNVGEEEVSSLCLREIAAAPPLGAAEWDEVARSTERHREAPDAPKNAVRVAIVESDRLRIDVSYCEGGVELFDRVGTSLGTFTTQRDDVGVFVVAPQEVVDEASLIAFADGGSRSGFAIVHHPARVRPTPARKTLQRELHRALGAMTADPSQLGEVLKIIDKAIFDDDGIKAPEPAEPGRASSGVRASTGGGSMEISVDDVKRRSKRARSVADRNLAVVLDLLLHKVGQGIGAAAEPTAEAPPEVEEKDLEAVPDEQPDDVPPSDVKPDEILRACHRKVARLLDRMTKRLSDAESSSRAAMSVVAQLAAVLGLLRWLRRIEPSLAWVPFGESTIPEAPRNNFFWAVADHFVTHGRSLIDHARDELGPDPWTEASHTLGLLVWLAWECEIDQRSLKLHPDADEEVDYHWVARLAWCLREAALENDAVAVARTAMGGVRRWHADPAAWLDHHVAWGEVIALLESDPAAVPLEPRRPKRGDLALVTMPNGARRVEFVLRVDDRKVYVADTEHEDGRPILATYVQPIDWRNLLPATAAASAG